MANCHDIFLAFNQIIKLSDKDRNVLISSRDNLRERMLKNFLLINESERGTHNIDFQSQGSFVMDTIITPEQDDFDLDDGVYFLGQLSDSERINPSLFHDLIIKAIDKHHQIEDITDKDTCVRVRYSKTKDFSKEGGYHIDIPIYYKENSETPELAHKKKGWVESSPVELIDWFEAKINSGFQKGFLVEASKYQVSYEKWLQDIRKNDHQLRRLVRYLKAWADLKRKEMPSGIMMTIFVANNFILDDRDDISLLRTLENIDKYFEKYGIICLRPTPKKDEDLFENFKSEAKTSFRYALQSLIVSGNQALDNPYQKEACLKWKKHFGNRFPCQYAKEEVEGAKKYSTPAAIFGDSAKSAK